MKEKEWLDRIRASAQDVKVPDSLTPENIGQRLKKDGSVIREEEDRDKESQDKEFRDKEPRKEKRRGFILRTGRKAGMAYGITAAAAVIVLLGGYTAIWAMNGGIGKSASRMPGVSQSTEFSAAADVKDDGNDEAGEACQSPNAAGGEEASMDSRLEAESAAEPRRNAGDLFVLADNYQEVYDVIEVQNKQHSKEFSLPEMDLGYAPAEEKAAGSDAAASYISSQLDAAKSSSEQLSHSTTNVQTKGVDESDIVKTDGSYIYTVAGNQVVITDIRDGRLEKTGVIELPAGGADETVREMYVDQNRLILIAEGTNTRMDHRTQRKETEEEEGNQDTSQEAWDGQAESDYYYIDTREVTAIYTYDITSRSKPVLLGTGVQDGSYNTSRKIGEMIYLFTQEIPDISRVYDSAGEEDYDFIPLVNDKRIAADCIYIPRQGSNALIVSSFYMDKPQEQADNIMIVNNGNNVYVSQNAVYLYESDYAASVTKIAKFSLGAKLNAIGAVSVRGLVTDSFAVNDYKGSLRVLTTYTGGGQTNNNLYLMDEQLNITGKLEGMAPGETIYSARYLENTAYFVTYRNIDPLFAVDLSDVKNPVILGELKITGYSEYLHFWGDDKLLGIGYETNPDNGAVKGVKMAMFDISNPAEMKTVDSCVIKDTSHSPALTQYKAALVDRGANLIGFAVSGYEQGNRKDSYVLFEWKDGKFSNLLTQSLSAELTASDYRGLYAGRIFYLVSGRGISSFDMDGSYKRLKSLDFTAGE